MNGTDRYDATGEIVSAQVVWSILLGASIVLLLGTRVITGQNSQSTANAPLLPYWIPYFGQVLEIWLQPSELLQLGVSSFSSSSFAFKYSGRIYNVIYTDAWCRRALDDQEASLESTESSWEELRLLFGSSRIDKIHHQSIREEIDGCLARHFSSTKLREFHDGVKKQAELHGPHFVTFVEAEIDQTAWERKNDVQLSPSGASVEASFFGLTTHFSVFCIMSVLMGTSFLEDNPQFLSDWLDFIKCQQWLRTGLPRWLPSPATTAHIARRRCINCLTVFHRKFDGYDDGSLKGNAWRDFGDVGPLMKDLVAIWRRQKTSYALRSSYTLRLLSQLCFPVASLSFWTMAQVYDRPEHLSALRAVLLRSCTAKQPKQELALPEPPRLSIDVEAIQKNSLVNKYFQESKRVYSLTWHEFNVKKRLVLKQEAKSANQEALIYNSNAHIVLAPNLVDVLRGSWELSVEENPAPQGTNVDERFHKGNFVVMRSTDSLCLTFVATIVLLWDVKAVKADRSVPKAAWCQGARYPETDVRVRIERRVLSSVTPS